MTLQRLSSILVFVTLVSFLCFIYPWCQSYFHVSSNLLILKLSTLLINVSIKIFLIFSVPTEVQLVKREYFNRWYGLKAYYAALVCSRTPSTIFFSLIYLFITYPLTAQPMELSRILMFSTTCILIALISESMGTVISSMLSVVVRFFLFF